MFTFCKIIFSRFWLAASLALIFAGTPSAYASPRVPAVAQHPGLFSANAPETDANYLYDQLAYMSSHFWRRESGYDLGLPPNINGHNEFANYWAQEMLRNLQGFGPQVSHYAVAGAGWARREAVLPGDNVEITVPGGLYPTQMVVIGCHYDGMANSTQSAFDDTSGCAAELAVAKAMGKYWRANHLFPARTLRFVIFDAEEQGILGSYYYVNSTVNGDTANIVAMINEEQIGISYPLRFLGKFANPFTTLDVVPSDASGADSRTDPFYKQIRAMVPAVFQQMRDQGYTSLSYHGDNGQEINGPIFTPDQIRDNVPVIPTDQPGFVSDNMPFGMAGVPNVTFVAAAEDANSNDDHRIPQQYGYPIDTQHDTLQLMNGYASGSTQKSQALVLALDLPALFTAWLLNQSNIAGQVPVSNLSAGPIATIADIGCAQPGTQLSLDAQAAFDPQNPQATFQYHWDFGDGSQADGMNMLHSYAAPGTYTLTLSVSDAAGTRQVRKTLFVTSSPPVYPNWVAQFQQKNLPNGSVTHAQYQQPPITGDLQPPAIMDRPATRTQSGSHPTVQDHSISSWEIALGIGMLCLCLILLVWGWRRRLRSV